jgi:hypothetical protein
MGLAYAAIMEGRPVTSRTRSRHRRQRRGPDLDAEAPWAPIPCELLQSPAWKALTLSARRVLDRILIEHMQHGGQENGKLAVTYDDFEAYGIHRHAIGPAIRECDALGLLRITRRGRAGNAEHRASHLFRLTFLPFRAEWGERCWVNASHEWRRIGSSEAEIKARQARNAIAPVRRRSRPISIRRKNRTPVAESATNPSGGFRH